MKIYIQLDNSLIWDIVKEGDPYFKIFNVKPRLSVDDELFERAKRISKEFYEIQHELELLYRIQEGLKTRDGDGVPPPHNKLNRIE